MKFFNRKRLKEYNQGSSKVFKWRSFNMFELFILFIIPISLASIIGGLMGMKEVFDIKVVELSDQGYLIFFSAQLILLLHFLFNRNIKLILNKDSLSYKRRRILGISRKVKFSEIEKLKIKRLLNLAESPPDGTDLTSHNLNIYLSSRRKIVIRGLSDDDCKTIEEAIKQVRNEQLNLK